MARMGEDDSRESKRKDYWKSIEVRKEDHQEEKEILRRR